ncbi:MAG TPA: transglutaminase-like domain-containing protein [Candidatus Acidoferrum sp.]
MLLVASLLSLGYTSMREYSVRRYLKGFSDAIVPRTASPEAKVEAILTWMRSGPARPIAAHPNELGPRDPENTLNYQQLLAVCGTATNAFLNLARSTGLDARRLLLLTPERTAKHVVSEVLIDGRWIVVDATYRVILRDAQSRMLTRKDLQNPEILAEATGKIPNYLPIYDYKSFAHVRVARLPMDGLGLRRMLQTVYPGWEEAADWSLLLERESFFYFFISAVLSILFLGARIILAWYADHHLRVSRFRVRHQVARASATFFSAPELEE